MWLRLGPVHELEGFRCTRCIVPVGDVALERSVAANLAAVVDTAVVQDLEG